MFVGGGQMERQTSSLTACLGTAQTIAGGLLQLATYAY